MFGQLGTTRLDFPITQFFEMVCATPGMAGPHYRAIIQSIDLSWRPVARSPLLVRRPTNLGCDFVGYYFSRSHLIDGAFLADHLTRPLSFPQRGHATRVALGSPGPEKTAGAIRLNAALVAHTRSRYPSDARRRAVSRMSYEAGNRNCHLLGALSCRILTELFRSNSSKHQCKPTCRGDLWAKCALFIDAGGLMQ